MKNLLKIKFAWFPVWSVAVLMLSMILIYLPVFSGADQRMHDFPLILVSEDSEFADSPEGKAIISNLVKQQDGHSFEWQIESSKETAIQAIKENKANGALIIPANFSEQTSALQQSFLSGETDITAVPVEILLNDGASQMASSISTTVLQTLASSISDMVSSGIKADMTKQQILLSPMAASQLDHPIEYTMTNVLGLPSDINKGMTPFMIVLIASITGLMGTQMINGYLGGISDNLKRHGVPLTYSKVFATEILLSAILMIAVAILIPSAVFGLFGSFHSSGIIQIFLFTLLCTMTMFAMFKMIGMLFGKWAMLAAFPVNILGIFASGGAIPVTNLPDFHRVLGNMMPIRYMIEGMRSLLYYNGNMESGLGKALIIVPAFFLLFSAIIVIVFLWKRNQANKNHHNQQQNSSSSAQAAVSA
ncbi:ABC transporter permease [Paenibacillus gallinarum]|uniref:ABC transporter permease n=1 Tax=Paenibacillus gallinarum TaxID=2762232 RepID=A0ABR8SZU8_9BACL|nr:ABC transporter permease [Paenibacillus gallinarum]MBD7968818.1 ABC transporter permease [Paenibacillus gallinarum]